ncbi:sulfotransferase ssu-1-like [Ornithodoros turicata]|uniref:sulfotransferase ssu-1-like n=1 Tax=Ornithodoros turicata TaxID=34597 RepID=UPI003138FF70
MNESKTSRKRPSFKVHPASGWIVPRGQFPFASLEAAMQYQPSEGDIIVMTYPKSGTTWVQYMTYLLLNNLQPIPSGRRLGEFIPFIDDAGTKTLSDVRPRGMKTHLSFEVFPWSALPRYICVARNPWDCCVSFFHHTRGFLTCYDYEDGKFDDFFEDFLEGQIECGDYFDHLLSLWKYHDKDNVLFLTYEEMSANRLGCAQRIIDHLRPIFPRGWQPDAEDLAAKSRIDVMKADDPSKWCSARPKGVPGFIRRGVVGDWKNHFAPEQSRRLSEKFVKKLGCTGAGKLWNELEDLQRELSFV